LVEQNTRKFGGEVIKMMNDDNRESIKGITVTLKGFTCLSCGQTKIEVLDTKARKTIPCDVCGDSKPSIITLRNFYALIRRRNNMMKEKGWSWLA
jgi:hypothetical protein